MTVAELLVALEGGLTGFEVVVNTPGGEQLLTVVEVLHDPITDLVVIETEVRDGR